MLHVPRPLRERSVSAGEEVPLYRVSCRPPVGRIQSPPGRNPSHGPEGSPTERGGSAEGCERERANHPREVSLENMLPNHDEGVGFFSCRAPIRAETTRASQRRDFHQFSRRLGSPTAPATHLSWQSLIHKPCFCQIEERDIANVIEDAAVAIKPTIMLVSSNTTDGLRSRFN